MPNKIDIVDQSNQPTGQTAEINEVLKKGLWHRGAHVVICTKTGYVLVQKRAKTMLMHPGLLDFSVGGFVDAGEAPEHAAIREVREEVGLEVAIGGLQPLGVYRKNHAWPAKHKRDRAFIHAYVVILPDHHVDIAVQHEEVEWSKFITMRELRQLIRRHRLKRLGRLEPTYRFYKDLLADMQRHRLGIE
jgi:8-oxo-dGTP pyrophosphatase MutT (NUDIX family)